MRLRAPGARSLSGVLGKRGRTMRFHTLILALVVALPSIVNGQQQVLVLDCPVSKANPIFDFADFREGASVVLMERYRFVISIGDRAGLATTPRASNIPALWGQPNYERFL